jgi:hypothetical protein
VHQHFASGFAQLATAFNDRIAAFEVIVESRFERVDARFDQAERSLEELKPRPQTITVHLDAPLTITPE